MKTTKGFVFYYDWLDQLVKLDRNDVIDVISAMVHFHRDGVEPPKLKGLADMATGFIIAQLRRMKEKGDNGKLGGRPRKSAPAELSEDTTINNNVENDSVRGEKAEAVECDKRGKEPYGDFKNVYLSEKEYEELRARFPLNYQKRINDLSYYINAKGNKYVSHYGAILNWNRNQEDKISSENSTFETDEFFASAVERSNRRALERLNKTS